MLFSNITYQKTPIDFNKPVVAFLKEERVNVHAERKEGFSFANFENGVFTANPATFIIKLKIDEALNVQCLSPEFETAFTMSVGKEALEAFGSFNDFMTTAIRASVNGKPIIMDNHALIFQIENEDTLSALDKVTYLNPRLDSRNSLSNTVIERLKEKLNGVISYALMTANSKDKSDFVEQVSEALSSLYRDVFDSRGENEANTSTALYISKNIAKRIESRIFQIVKAITEVSPEKNEIFSEPGKIKHEFAKIIQEEASCDTFIKALFYTYKLDFKQTLLQTDEEAENMQTLKEAFF